MTIVKVSDPVEILSYIPYQLGFQPTESLVVVGIRDTSRIGLSIRIDLSDVLANDGDEHPGEDLAMHLAADGATSCFVVLYTNDPWQDSLNAEDDLYLHPEFAHHCARLALAFADIDIKGIWVVSDQHCAQVEGPDGRVSTSFDPELMQFTQISALMVMNGVQVMSHRDELGHLVDYSSEQKQRFDLLVRDCEEIGYVAAVEHWNSLLSEESASITEYGSGGERPIDTPEFAEIDPHFVQALGHIPFRDALIVGLIPGFQQVAMDLVTTADIDPELTFQVGSALSRILDPLAGVAPRSEMIHEAQAYLERVAPLGSSEQRAAALTVLGVIAWWTGDGARAAVRVEQALTEAPDYRLAHLLDRVIANGLAPGWARSHRMAS